MSLTREVARVVHRHVRAVAKNVDLGDVEGGKIELGQVAIVGLVGELAADMVK